MPITESASIGQIVSDGLTAVFATRDVIDLAPKESIVFADQTIFAKIVCPGSNREPNLRVQAISHDQYVDVRALLPGA
jgi:hypothetical protein